MRTPISGFCSPCSWRCDGRCGPGRPTARICLLAEATSAHTRRWAGYFALLGWEVHVLSLRPGAVAGARVHAVAPPLGRPGYLLGAPAVRRLVRTLRPDLLHAHYLTSYGLLGALSGCHPFVASAWGSDVSAGAARSPLLRAAVRFALRRADAICATSHALAALTRPYAPAGAAIHVTPFGVDCRRFRPPAGGPPPGSPCIGSVRALERIYGLDVLLRAAAQLMPQFPDLRLRLVGDGSARAQLAALADGLGLVAAVEWRGRVPAAALPGELAQMHAFAAPSRVPEAFGVALLEAEACG
ncbi:MAG: glycosyltransferase, partial [Chloroflexi bacterium]|nr:glycosyltransferase [Chloroflexota bacterium]